MYQSSKLKLKIQASLKSQLKERVFHACKVSDLWRCIFIALQIVKLGIFIFFSEKERNFNQGQRKSPSNLINICLSIGFFLKKKILNCSEMKVKPVLCRYYLCPHRRQELPWVMWFCGFLYITTVDVHFLWHLEPHINHILFSCFNVKFL